MTPLPSCPSRCTVPRSRARHATPAWPRRLAAWAAAAGTAALVALPACAATPEPAAGEGIAGGSLWTIFQRGGPVMWPILLLSVVGFGLILEFLFTTRRAALLPAQTEADLESPDRTTAATLIATGTEATAVALVMRAGHRWRHGTDEQVQAAIEEAVATRLWKHRRALRPLGIMSNTAPLLGLLGTVFGIIQAFDVVARQGALGDPTALADGIAQALITTAFGLIVAIPLLLAYHYFLGKVESLLHRCEELAKEALILPPDEPR